MAKKPSSIPVLTLQRSEKPPEPIVATLQKSMNPRRQWLLFSILLLVGLIILGTVSSITLGWLKNIHISINPASTPIPIQTFTVQRTVNYAGLAYTILNVQTAPSFTDDGIHSGAAVVRVNMHVSNPSSDQISVMYYDIARLLVPKLNSLAPTNTSLSAGPQPGTSETGWIDFSVPQSVQLDTLKLQLGSNLLGEYLVTLPFTGKFNANIYADHTSAQNLDINYYFPHNAPQLLVYHLASVNIRYSYRGMQAKAGQQFYVLNFHVTNPNSNTVSPGFGYDYIRLSFNGGPIHPPIDNTLPYSFPNTRPINGSVIFAGPAGTRAVTIDFLVQFGSGGSTYSIAL